MITPNSERWLNLKDLPGEEWRDIKDFEGLYQISNYGRVKSFPKYHNTSNDKNKRGYTSKCKILRCGYKISGYLFVNLYKNKRKQMVTIHKLVCYNFMKKDEKSQLIMHLDNNKQNNHISNLKFGTYKENIQDAYNDGLHSNMKAVIQYDKNNNKINDFKSITDASKKTKISITSIANCLKGLSKTSGGYIWKYKEKEREEN